MMITKQKFFRLVITGALIVLGMWAYRTRFVTGVSAVETQSPIVDSGQSSDIEMDSRWLTADITQQSIDNAAHPLTPLIEVAQRAIDRIDAEIFDYTATLTNQIRVKGTLREPYKLQVKIRHGRTLPQGEQIPFSIYTRFVEPSANAGREVLWVEGWNDGNLMVHLTGWQNLMRINLDPNGSMAMDGNLYPVTKIGMRNLLVQIHEKGARDLNHAPGKVSIKRGLEVNGRQVTMIESIHPQREDHFEYHIARIYLDEELGLAVGYEGYLWPEKPGDPPILLEKYFYTDIQVNVGLKDIDFDPANPAYDFPTR